MAELAPMPMAREARITMVDSAFLQSMRQAKRKSWSQMCMVPPAFVWTMV